MVAPNSLNRIAGFLPQSARRELPPLPTTPEGRVAVMADVMFTALLTLQALMTDPDPKVAVGAATAALDFEKTRLRHGRDVAGTTVPPEPVGVDDGEGEADGPATDDPQADDEAEFDEYVRQVQDELQDMEDGLGNGVTVTFERAAKLAAKRLREAARAERKAAEAAEAPPAVEAVTAVTPVPVVEPEPEPEFQDLVVEDDDPAGALRAMTDHTCEACRSWTVARERLLNVAVGRRAAPKCMDCLAGEFDMRADELMHHIYNGVRRRPHFWQAWQEAARTDADGADGAVRTGRRGKKPAA